MRRIGKQSLKDALVAHGGVVKDVAAAFRVSRQTIYSYIEQYQLQPEIDRARDAMFQLAEDNILAAVANGDLETSKFVVLHMPSSRRRWSNRTDVVTTDVGALAISEDVAQLMREQGIQAADVLREFEALIRAEAEAAGKTPAVVEGKVSRRRGK